MLGASKILTVSYGTFSCTLEGFEEPFSTMKAIAEYFRDLAAEDRYFGAEPPTPDAEMLHRIAEREIQRRVEAKISENGVVLRPQADIPPAAEAPAPAAPAEPVARRAAPAAAPAQEPAPAPKPESFDRPVRAATAIVPAIAATEGGGFAADEDSVAAKLMRIRAAVAESRRQAEAARRAAEEDFEDDEPADDLGEAQMEVTEDFGFDLDLDEAPAMEAVAEPAAAEDDTFDSDEILAALAATPEPEPEPQAEVLDELAEADAADTAQAEADEEPAAGDEDDAGAIESLVASLAEDDETEDEPADIDLIALDEGSEPDLPAMTEAAETIEAVAEDAPAAVAEDDDEDEAGALATVEDEDVAEADEPAGDAAFAMAADADGYDDDEDAATEDGAFDAEAEDADLPDEAEDTRPAETAATDADDQLAAPDLTAEDETAAEVAPATMETDDTPQAGYVEVTEADDDREESVIADEDSAYDDAEPEYYVEPLPEAAEDVADDEERAVAALVAGSRVEDAAPPAELGAPEEPAVVAADVATAAATDAAAAADPEPAAEYEPEAEPEPVRKPGFYQRAVARVIKLRSAVVPHARAARTEEADSDLEEAAILAAVARAEPEDLPRLESGSADVRDELPLDDDTMAAQMAADDTSLDDEEENLVAGIGEALGETSLSQQDEADLVRELAEVSRGMGDGRGLLAGGTEADEADVSRLIEEANTKLEGAENRRRFSAIAHLKAAVAATVADRKLKTTEAPEAATDEGIEAYRDDLSKAVRPRRPAAEGGQATRRPVADARPTPLVLVSEQRVDQDGEAASEPSAVRPRRVVASRPALIEDDEDLDLDDEDDLSPEEARNFAEFAERLGAVNLADLLEAAAAYTAAVEGREHFSRPHLLKKVATVAAEDESFSREDGLRSFGTLLRQGKIQKVRRGQFALNKSSKYISEARRAAL